MKLSALFLLLFMALACNETKKSDSDGTNKDAATEQAIGKSSFMSSCMIDASNPLRTPDEENRDIPANLNRVKQFCECAWEKTNGKYPGSIIADKSKLKRDVTLASCWQAAHP
ncbi:MAG: hypothetical protein Q8941_04995 [Bacteroidota bacterium]|nr:hypothetical protein [Bacteroidota bacterium]